MSEIFSKILKDKNGKVLNVGSKYKQPEWGSKTAIVDILPETELTVMEEVSAAMVMQEVTLTEGNVYTVNYNGTEYACTAISNGSTNLLLGNAGAIDETFPVTDEPFIFMTIPEEQRDQYMGACAVAMPLDGSTTFTLSIRGEVETVYEIPAKYTASKNALVVTTSDGERASVSFDKIRDAVNAGTLVYFTDTSGNIIPLNMLGMSTACFVVIEVNGATVDMTEYTIDHYAYLHEHSCRLTGTSI